MALGQIHAFHRTYSRFPNAVGQGQAVAFRIIPDTLVIFIFIARKHTDARFDTALLSVRLSVCLSVRHVLVFYENSFTYCHSFFTTW